MYKYVLLNFYSSIWLFVEEIYKPKQIFFMEFCSLIFLFGTQIYILYNIYARYGKQWFCFIILNSSFRWYRNNTVEGKMKWIPYEKRIELEGGQCVFAYKNHTYFGKHNESVEIWKSLRENEHLRINGIKWRHK
jgi:hypothetical protein